jgi:hypothetical protein
MNANVSRFLLALMKYSKMYSEEGYVTEYSWIVWFKYMQYELYLSKAISFIKRVFLSWREKAMQCTPFVENYTKGLQLY